MTKTTILMAAFTLGAFSTAALAQAPAPAPAAPAKAAPAAPAKAAPAPAAAPAAAPAPMEVPKPSAEAEMFKKWTGTWSCEGSGKTPDGKELKYKSTWTWKSVLGGHWFGITYKHGKVGAMPAFEGNGFAGYDLSDKKYVFKGFDNFGGWIDLTSTDGMSYSGPGVPNGKKGTVKISFAKGKDKKGQESDKLIDVTLDFGVVVNNETCKK